MPASPRSGASSDRKRHASSADRTTPVGCRSSRLRATGRESAAAVPSRARRVSCGFVNSRPRRRIDPSVVAQISSAGSETSGLSPDSRKYASENAPPASEGGTTRIPRRSRLSGRGSRSGRLHSDRRERTPGSSARVRGAASAAMTSASGLSPARRRSAGSTSLRTSRAAASTASSRNARSSPRAGGSAPSVPRRTPGGRIARETGGIASARRLKRSLSWGSSRTGRQRGWLPFVPGATRRRSRRSNTQRATSAQ